MIQIPGQALEQAAADLGTEAGKSVLGALRRRAEAWSAVHSAEDEAKAEEIKANIIHKGNVDRAKALAAERREQEKLDLEHAYQLSDLSFRAIRRLSEQAVDEQKRLEWIGNRSFQIASSDPDGSDAREIPDDWLKRFFKYAADVDESQLLEMLARALADAAMRSRPILSPKALDTLRFFEVNSFEMYKSCAYKIGLVDSLPIVMLENLPLPTGQEIDVVLMKELGLLKEERKKHVTYRLGNFFITFSYDTGVNFEFRVIEKTYVGRSISDLLDRRLGRVASGLYTFDIAIEVTQLQQDLGLNETFCGKLANYILSQIGDTGSVDIKSRIIHQGKPIEAFSGERKRHTDPFQLEKIRECQFDDQFTKSCVDAFIDTFTNFDTNQLPYMYTDDNR